MPANLTSLASDYISEMASSSDLEWDDFMERQRDFYRKHADHISDCFTDTRYWVEDEGFTQAEFEAEIVRLVMDESNG